MKATGLALAGLERKQLHMPGRAAHNGADGRIQDTTQHLHDQACTHKSSHVQGVQECGWEGGASHRDARVCETRSLTRLCVPFEMRDVCLGEGDGGGAWIGRVCADSKGDGY